MKLPTKKQWLEIGKAFDTPHKKRTTRQRYIARSGLCSAVDAILNDFFGGISTPEYMIPDIIVFGKFKNVFWVWDEFAGDRQRAFFCCMMGAITEAGDMEEMIEEA